MRWLSNLTGYLWAEGKVLGKEVCDILFSWKALVKMFLLSIIILLFVLNVQTGIAYRTTVHNYSLLKKEVNKLEQTHAKLQFEINQLTISYNVIDFVNKNNAVPNSLQLFPINSAKEILIINSKKLKAPLKK